MKILLMADYSYPANGGTERLVFGIAKWMKEHGIQADILSPDWGSNENSDIYPEGIHIRKFGFKTGGTGKPLKRIWKFVNEARKMGKYDVYHGFGTVPIMVSTAIIGKLKRKRTVGTLYSVDSLDNCNSILRSLIRRMDVITVPFKTVEVEIKNQLKTNNVHTILVWVDEQFKPLGLDEENAILYVGRAVKEKGIFELIEAFKEIKDIFGCELWLVGAKTEELPKTDGMKVFGFVSEEELVRIYNKAKVLVAPSKGRNNYTWTFMEAMRCGKPVLITCPFKYGIKIQPTKESIKSGLEMILSDSILRKREGDQNHQIAKYFFDKDKIMNQYLDVYKGV